MSPPTLPSLDIAESVKSAFTEADVHSKLFEPDMVALGFPARVRSQADGEYFLEQGHLALRRLRTKLDRRQRGHWIRPRLLRAARRARCSRWRPARGG